MVMDALHEREWQYRQQALEAVPNIRYASGPIGTDPACHSHVSMVGNIDVSGIPQRLGQALGLVCPDHAELITLL